MGSPFFGAKEVGGCAPQHGKRSAHNVTGAGKNADLEKAAAFSRRGVLPKSLRDLETHSGTNEKSTAFRAVL